MNISNFIDVNIIKSIINPNKGPLQFTTPGNVYFIRKVKQKNTKWAGSSAW